MEEKRTLESWKEIADYLKRSEKTCRRLEQELKLPVHRLEETPKARVFAYKDEIDRWIKETQHSEEATLTSSEITLPITSKKLLIPALVVFAAIIAALIIWPPWSRDKAAQIPSSKPSIAVLYFENNSGDKNLDHYRNAIPDLLITDLAQSKHLRILSESKLFEILKELNLHEEEGYSSEDLKNVAARGRVDHFVLGGLAMAGDMFRINILIQDAKTAELVGTEGVEGRGEESIFAMVDELTRKIKANFNLTQQEIAADMDMDIGEITTNSPEALKYYTEGMRFYRLADLEKVVSLMEEAVSIDPEFAMAYVRMATAYEFLGRLSKQKSAIRKAFELIDRVSVRETYNIQGEFYRTSYKTHDKAIAAYHKLLELYPDDIEGNNNLAMLYDKIGELDKAIEQYEISIRNRDSGIRPYLALAGLYRRTGRYEKSLGVCEKYLKNFPDNVEIHFRMARAYLYQGEYDTALKEVDKAFSLNPNHPEIQSTKLYILRCKGEFGKIEEEMHKRLDSTNQKVRYNALMGLARLYMLQGRFEEMKEMAIQGLGLWEKAEESWMDRNMRYFLSSVYWISGQPELALEELDKIRKSAAEDERLEGQTDSLWDQVEIYLEMHRVDEALKKMDEIKIVLQEAAPRQYRIFHHLMGLIELERENYSKAIESLKKANSLQPGAHKVGTYSLAMAYDKSGDFTRAISEYEKIILSPVGLDYYGINFIKSFYTLGKIYEHQGNKSKAIEHYEKFLDLWKDADPDIHEVIDAKKRLAELKTP